MPINICTAKPMMKHDSSVGGLGHNKAIRVQEGVLAERERQLQVREAAVTEKEAVLRARGDDLKKLEGGLAQQDFMGYFWGLHATISGGSSGRCSRACMCAYLFAFTHSTPNSSVVP